MLSFPGPRHDRRASPHAHLLAALVRLLERTCPPVSARTLPDDLRELLKRLDSRVKPDRVARAVTTRGSRAREAGPDRAP